MKTNETSTRQQALEWWKELCLSCELDDTHYILDSLIRKYTLGFERKYTSLTGREIEEIWRKETQTICNESPREFLKNNPKPNQKQFKEFNPELFKAYINKFNKADRIKAILEIVYTLSYNEVKFVLALINDVQNERCNELFDNMLK